MKHASVILAMTTALLGLAAPPASAQNQSGVEKLYILNCGEGVAGDISRWSPGVNVGKSQDFVDNCYLIKHRQGWLLWDTGITDAIAAKPDGEPPADRGATHWRRPKTLVSQLDQLGVKPSEPIHEESIHGQTVGLVRRLSMMRIIARRTKAATVAA